MKWFKQPAALLLILLASTSLVMTVTGLTLKHTVASESQQIQDTFAIAVPFILLRGDVRLDADIIPDEVKSPFQNPEDAVTPPEDPLMQAGKQALDKDAMVFISQSDVAAEPVDKWQVSRSFVHVEEDYFDTALFIGDSRTVGLANNGRLGQADYFADVGMSTFNLFEKSISDQGFDSTDLRTLLQTREYETIYIMLGINELGYPMESIERKYREIVSEVSELQPDAAIILQANLTITKKKDASTDKLSLERIQQLNGIIASMADGKRIFYVDANPYFADEEGYLRGDVTGDGVHPYARDYRDWAIWLKDYGLAVDQ